MKKYLLILLWLFFTIPTFALTIKSESDQSFRINQWEVSVLPITIKADGDWEITKQNWFNLTLLPDSNFRFNSSWLNNIVISWALNKIDKNSIKVSNDLLSVHFDVIQDFLAWDQLVISGVGLVVYNKQVWYRNIWLDINGDKYQDVVDYYWIRILDMAWYYDTLAPNEVFSFTGNIDSTNLNISWLNPWDIDFQVTKVEFLDFSKNIMKEIYKYDQTTNISTDLWWISFVRIKTIDFKGNTSNWVTKSIEDFRNTMVSNNTDINSWVVLTWDNSLNTWSSVITWVIVNTWTVINTWLSLLSKYYPVFRTKSFEDFMIKFDDLISFRTKWFEVNNINNITLIRNNIIKSLEDYENQKINKQQTLSILIENVKNFRVYIK